MENTREEFNSFKEKGIVKLNTCCTNCFSTVELQYHHIVPLGAGGTNNPSNIVTLCGICHSKVHGKNSLNNINSLIDKAKKEKVQKGSKACGNTPLGYKWNAAANVEIDIETAPIVKEIFSLALKGLSLQKIADSINTKGFKTQRGNKFSKQAIGIILTNEYYTGMIIHGDIKEIGTHEPLINKITFGKVQAQLKKRKK